MMGIALLHPSYDLTLKAAPTKPTQTPARRRKSFQVIQGDLFDCFGPLVGGGSASNYCLSFADAVRDRIFSQCPGRRGSYRAPELGPVRQREGCGNIRSHQAARRRQWIPHYEGWGCEEDRLHPIRDTRHLKISHIVPFQIKAGPFDPKGPARRMGRALAKPIAEPHRPMMGFAALYPSYARLQYSDIALDIVPVIITYAPVRPSKGRRPVTADRWGGCGSCGRACNPLPGGLGIDPADITIGVRGASLKRRRRRG